MMAIIMDTLIAKQEVLESDPLATAVMEFIRGRAPWVGTATALLAALNEPYSQAEDDAQKAGRGRQSKRLKTERMLAEVGHLNARTKSEDGRIPLDSACRKECGTNAGKVGNAGINLGRVPEPMFQTARRHQMSESSCSKPATGAASDLPTFRRLFTCLCATGARRRCVPEGIAGQRRAGSDGLVPQRRPRQPAAPRAAPRNGALAFRNQGYRVAVLERWNRSPASDRIIRRNRRSRHP